MHLVAQWDATRYNTAFLLTGVATQSEEVLAEIKQTSQASNRQALARSAAVLSVVLNDATH